MDPLTISLIAGGVLGMLKGNEQQRAYKDAQKIEAMKTRWSPFTGQRGQNLQRPSTTDPLMQGLVAGGLMGKQFGGGAADPTAVANPYANTGTGAINAAPNLPGANDASLIDPSASPMRRQPYYNVG